MGYFKKKYTDHFIDCPILDSVFQIAEVSKFLLILEKMWSWPVKKKLFSEMYNNVNLNRLIKEESDNEKTAICD